MERALRDHIMEWVRQRADKNGGFLYRDELLGFHLNGERMPIIDITRGSGIREYSRRRCRSLPALMGHMTIWNLAMGS